MHQQRAFLCGLAVLFNGVQSQQQKFPVAFYPYDRPPRQLLLHRARIVNEIRFPQRDAEDPPPRNLALHPARHRLDFRKFWHNIPARSSYHTLSSAVPGTRATFIRLEECVRFLLWFCFSFLIASLAVATRTAARTQETGFLDRTLSVHGTTYKYQVFVPDNWSPKKKWPIILFLHGAGERGKDGLLQTDVGLPHAIRENRSRFPSVVVIPQCLTDHWWSEPDMEEVSLGALAAATREFKGDPKRTYLTGLSMGGYGSWALATQYPGKFAAIVPICGGIVTPQSLLKA